MADPSAPSAGIPHNSVAPYEVPQNAAVPYGPPQNSAIPHGAEATAPAVQLPDDQLPFDSESSAPPRFVPSDISGLQSYEGYQDVGFQTGHYVPPPSPPSYSEATTSGNGSGDMMEFDRTADISESEAREALLGYVSQRSCYGKGAANDMEMSKISPCNGLHYILETFCEGRTTARTEVPYYGGEIDGPFNGLPPLPWEIPCVPQQGQFQQQLYNIPVPHTAEVRTCGMCSGARIVLCFVCRGCALLRCSYCHGSGRTGTKKHRRSCRQCGGRGRVICPHCVMGKITCPHCAGYGQVVNFIQLTVAYMNYKKDYILEQTDLPNELVRTVEGKQIFQQSHQQLLPLHSFPVREIGENSQRMIEAEKTMHPSERQLNQRHTVRAVPVTQIDYKFRGDESKFFVYGNSRAVYCPDYPQQCCWGCNIL